jgi:hypothetical protein
MSDSVRKQIRDALKSALTGLTTSGSRVYTHKVYPSGAASIPGLNILTGDDTLGEDGIFTGGVRLRTMSAVVECRAKPAEGVALDDQLDMMIDEVDVALKADRTLGGLCLTLEREKMSDALTPNLERPAGVAFIAVAIQYLV